MKNFIYGLMLYALVIASIIAVYYFGMIPLPIAVFALMIATGITVLTAYISDEPNKNTNSDNKLGL